jgi:uncharacterized protein YdhG (YjbR/CyaY superfamily)
MKGRNMASTKKKPATIAAYVQAAPKESRAKLRAMIACIRKAAPGVTAELKWGMPAFSDRRILVMCAGYKRHIGFYPTAAAVKAFEKDLTGYVRGRGSIQFSLEKPLPVGLIGRITRFRVREAGKLDRKWRS